MNTTKPGKKYNFGDIILALVQYTDTNEVKTRPALVLFEEFGNIVVIGITSNPEMKGIAITKKEGMEYESVLKLNYIFTITDAQIKRNLFSLSEEKKTIIKEELFKKIF